MVGFGTGSIANQHTRKQLLKDFQVIGWDEGKCSAVDFTKVRKGGCTLEPKLIGCLSSNGGGCGEVGKVSSGGTKLLPEVC